MSLQKIMTQNNSNFINHTFITNSTRPMPLYSITAKIDSGASKHYVRPEDKHCLSNIRKVPLTLVGLPDKSSSAITNVGTMSLSKKLTEPAQAGHILQDLKSATLLSAGQLCDDDCVVILDKHRARVQKNN